MRSSAPTRLCIASCVAFALLAIGCSSCKQSAGPADSGTTEPDLPSNVMPDFTPDPAACREAGVGLDAGYAASLPLEPAVVWTTKNVPAGPPVLGLEGEIIFGGLAGMVGIDASGAVKWAEAWPAEANGSLPAVATASRVIYTMGDQLLWLTVGGRVWATEHLEGPFTMSWWMSGPVVCDTETLFITEAESYTSPTKLHRYVDGVPLKLAVPGRGAQAMVCEWRGPLYLDSQRGEITALSQRGKLLWQRALAAPCCGVSDGTMALGPGGLLYVALKVRPEPGSDRLVSEVVALDRGCGAIRWRLPVKAEIEGPLLVDRNGDVIFVTWGGSVTFGGQSVPDYMYRISASGKLLWSKELEHSRWPGLMAYASVGPIGADGTIYTLINNDAVVNPAGQEPRLWALSPGGDLLWEIVFPNLSAGRGYQPILRKDGVLIFGAGFRDRSKYSAVVAVQTRSPGMRSGYWPRGRHDERNTSSLPLP